MIINNSFNILRIFQNTQYRGYFHWPQDYNQNFIIPYPHSVAYGFKQIEVENSGKVEKIRQVDLSISNAVKSNSRHTNVLSLTPKLCSLFF